MLVAKSPATTERLHAAQPSRSPARPARGAEVWACPACPHAEGPVSPLSDEPGFLHLPPGGRDALQRDPGLLYPQRTSQRARGAHQPSRLRPAPGDYEAVTPQCHLLSACYGLGTILFIHVRFCLILTGRSTTHEVSVTRALSLTRKWKHRM